MRGYLDEGRRRLEAIIAADDRDHVLAPGDRRRVLTAAGGVAYWQADNAGAYRAYREAVDLARASGTKQELADAIYDFSFSPVLVDTSADWTEILSLESPKVIAEAIALYRELGDEAGMARALWASADYRFFGGDTAGAEREASEALPIFRKLGDRFGLAWALHELTLVEIVTGRAELARAHAREALQMFQADGDLSGMNLLLIDLSSVALVEGQRPRALRLAAAGVTVAERNGIHLVSQSWTSPPFPEIPSPGGDAREQAWWDEGTQMDLDAAVAYAFQGLDEEEAQP